MIRRYYDDLLYKKKKIILLCLTFYYYFMLTTLTSSWQYCCSCDAFSITTTSSSSSLSYSRYVSERRNNIRNSLLLLFDNTSTKIIIEPNNYGLSSSSSSSLKHKKNGVDVLYDKRLVVVLASTTTSNSNDVVSNNDNNDYYDDDDFVTSNGNFVSVIYSICGIVSCLAWIYTSYVALSYHPDPKFANCSLRHNILTMIQAYAFPIPIMWTYFDGLRKLAKAKTKTTTTAILFKRFNLALGVASIWLSLSIAVCPSKFAFGYDLFTLKHKIIVGVIHGITGIFCLRMATAMKSTTNKTTTSIGQQLIRTILDSLFKLGPPPSNSAFHHKNSSAYAIGTIGLLWFTIQPLVSPYPLATIPTILGKRLSRPASAFTMLGAIIAYTLKDNKPSASIDDSCLIKKIRKILTNGLAVGSIFHLFLVALKIIGLDGGGLVLPGNGLWEVYPAMISVPFAASISFLIYAIITFATMTDG